MRLVTKKFCKIAGQLQKQSDQGRRNDTGWTKEAWKQATLSLNTELDLFLEVSRKRPFAFLYARPGQAQSASFNVVNEIS